ncbi:MAG: hypothetical protein OXE78_01225 [Gammaproteobacteria bacterium]|nr:hypothetical protein [Gammaproteobacteria bacterium]
MDVLSKRPVATGRTLERLISETAEPHLEPHILGMARKVLVRDGELLSKELKTDYPHIFHLPDCPPSQVDSCLADLARLLKSINRQKVKERCGQCLELAIFRALCAETDVQYFGRFPDFDPTAPTRPNKLFRKEEPPCHIGNRSIIGDRPLDFIYFHPTAGPAGLEAKNLREWLYPQGSEVKELLIKCIALDCVPILVARRLPSVTIELLGTCGVVLHQTLNQLYSSKDKELASYAMQQDLLCFDDIKVGDEPDSRLTNLTSNILPEFLPKARARFDKFKDLLARYANSDIAYHELAECVLLRETGKR